MIGDAAHWNGETWESLDSGTDYNGILAVVPAYPGIFAGGDFSRAGDKESWNIARWFESAAEVVSPEAAGAPELRIPNPYRVGHAILLEPFSHGPVQVCLYNSRGARIRELYNGDSMGSPTAVRWDGRTETGSRAEAGVYYLVARGTGGRMTGKVVVLR